MSEKNLQADIVIIGGGGSGFVAASAALEKGAESIIVLEKRAELGGNAVFPAGLLAINTRLQKRLGMDAHTDEVFRQAMYYGHWQNNARLIRALLDKSADTIDWLEKKGLAFTNIVTHYPNQSPNTYHITETGGTAGRQILDATIKECEDSRKVRIFLETPARKLLLGKDGRISGVLAQGKDGEISIATKCVIVCTGGFSDNEEMIKKYVPNYSKEVAPPRGIPQNGDGIMMTTEIGADVDGMVAFEWESFYRGSWFLTVLSRRGQTIWLNRRGERFCDEGIPVMAEAANAIGRQPGMVFYALLDEPNKQKLANDELMPFEAFFLKNETKGKAYTSFAAQLDIDLKEAVTKDSAIIASSLDEIAGWMGIEPAVLKNNVGEYNKFCDQGRDALFAKDRHLLQPLRTPPYYAIKCGVDLTNTHGGIKINERMQVMTREDEPIPGLYAAGVETGAKDWHSYNMWLSGHAFGFTVNTGRIAGEEAAAYVSGKC